MSSHAILTATATSNAKRVHRAHARPLGALLAASIGIASVVALGALRAPDAAYSATAVITVYAMAVYSATRSAYGPADARPDDHGQP
jgi:hypothetical protein